MTTPHKKTTYNNFYIYLEVQNYSDLNINGYMESSQCPLSTHVACF